MFCSVSCAAHLADMPGIKGQSRSNNMYQTGRWAPYCISDVGVCYTHTHERTNARFTTFFFTTMWGNKITTSSFILPAVDCLQTHGIPPNSNTTAGEAEAHNIKIILDKRAAARYGPGRNGTEGNIAATSMSFLMARNYICNCPQPKERMSFTMCNAFTFNVSWSFHEIAQLESL